VLCQETRADRFAWVDAAGTISNGEVRLDDEGRARTGGGRCVVLRPDIGRLLPVFVLDEYEGFDVKRFVDLSDAELAAYLDRNVAALRAAADWHRPDVVITGHAVPGGPIARRALDPRAYVAKVHGSDVEYAMRPQARYRELAREGLSEALAVAGASRDVLERCAEIVPGIEAISSVVHPGVDADAFRPRGRRDALLEAAERLATDPDTARGRPREIDDDVRRALDARDAGALDRLALAYDQAAPDADAAAVLRRFADGDGPLVGYFGKLIPQKGVGLLLAALTRTAAGPDALIVGFGLERERLQALAQSLTRGDAGAAAWLLAGSDAELGSLPPRGGVAFTGRLDHRYAPDALAALDVLVVPSILDEAFGMVAAEGAAAGALPLVARHSGLAEVAAALESFADRPGLFSFEPGAGAAGRIAAGIDRLLAIPAEERRALGRSLADHVRREWSWAKTADRLLALGAGRTPA
jgi:glycosyltransferase involved in cell wall biosynthesis